MCYFDSKFESRLTNSIIKTYINNFQLSFIHGSCCLFIKIILFVGWCWSLVNYVEGGWVVVVATSYILVRSLTSFLPWIICVGYVVVVVVVDVVAGVLLLLKLLKLELLWMNCIADVNVASFVGADGITPRDIRRRRSSRRRCRCRMILRRFKLRGIVRIWSKILLVIWYVVRRVLR